MLGLVILRAVRVAHPPLAAESGRALAWTLHGPALLLGLGLLTALYEHKVKLLAAADAEPGDLYPAGDGRFEFQRTVSRLEEMRSEEYMALGHGC